jgi:predicted nucleic acid-binding protein
VAAGVVRRRPIAACRLSDHEDVGLSRLQNDCLLALTARRTGALFVTADRHFEAIRRRLPFPLKILQV